MATTISRLLEGFSLAGTYLFSQQSDAEKIGKMLGLKGTFPVVNDEGQFWAPGRSFDELMARIKKNPVVPKQAHLPAPPPLQNPSPGKITFRQFTTFPEGK